MSLTATGFTSYTILAVSLVASLYRSQAFYLTLRGFYLFFLANYSTDTINAVYKGYLYPSLGPIRQATAAKHSLSPNVTGTEEAIYIFIRESRKKTKIAVSMVTVDKYVCKRLLRRNKAKISSLYLDEERIETTY